MTECPFTPPYPVPLKHKPGLIQRFRIGWSSWVHTLYERAYTMKMGATKLPRLSIFIVNEKSLVTRVLDDLNREFPKHWLLNDLLEPLIGNAIFVANGAEWEHQRQMVNPAFIHTNLKRAFPVMIGAAGELVERMRMRARAAAGAPVDIDPLMTHVTADIIFRTMFSMTLSEAEATKVYEAFSAYQKYAQRSTTLGIYGLPRFGIGRRVRAIGKQVRAAFAPIVAARVAERAAGRHGERKDILETLLDARHPVTGAPFAFHELVDQIAVIFLAGHETTATSLAWTLYLLSECPEWQDRVLAEIETVTGGAPVAFEHLKQLEQLRNLFKESLRLYPPVAFLPRMVTKPMVLRDKQVAAGDMVVAAPWLVHRNPDNWACPHAFDPDRFTRPEGVEAARHAWLPFGRGPRVCIGAGFAQQEAAVILAEIIRAFRLSYPDVPKPELIARLTLRPKAGIPLLLTERSAASDIS